MLDKGLAKGIFGASLMAVSIGSVVGLVVTICWLLGGQGFQWSIYLLSFLVIELIIAHIVLIYVGYSILDSIPYYDL